MRYVCKNPPGGGERNPYQLIDYIGDLSLSLAIILHKWQKNIFIIAEVILLMIKWTNV